MVQAEWWLENEEKWWQKALCRRCALQPIAQLTLQIFNETKKTSSATDKMFSRSHRGEKCFCTNLPLRRLSSSSDPRGDEAGDDAAAQLVVVRTIQLSREEADGCDVMW